MNSVGDVRNALTAQSRTATLDELQKKGHKKVQIIRAEQVAEMIAQSVNKAVESSGLLPQEEVEKLVAKSRTEFKNVLQERESEAQKSQQRIQELETAQSEVEQLTTQVNTLRVSLTAAEASSATQSDLESQLQTMQSQLSAAQSEVDAQAELESQLEGLQTRLQDNAQDAAALQEEIESQRNLIADFESRPQIDANEHQAVTSELVQAKSKITDFESRSQIDASEHQAVANELVEAKSKIVELEEFQAALKETEERANALREQLHTTETRVQELEAKLAEAERAKAAGASQETLMMLMTEIAQLKAAQKPAEAAPAAAPAGPDINDALDKLAGTLNTRLEQFGKKMGISAAVDSADVNFDAMFAHEDDQGTIESNMADVKVKSKSGGSIGANLARLKKLKGGG